MLTEKELRSLLFSKKGNTRKQIYEQYKDVIDSFSSHLNIVHYKERIFLFLNNLQEIPKCPICGENVKFILNNRKYANTCDKKSCRYQNTFQKVKNTCIEKFGVENPQQNKEIQEKTKQTLLERYNSTSSFLVDKKNKTWEEKYNGHPMYSKEIKNKVKITCEERYNGIGFSSKELNNKGKQTCLEIYGDKNYNNPGKIRKTCLERYNVENPAQNPLIKDKITQTIFDRYGVIHLMHSKSFRDKVTKEGQFSRLEKKLIELLINRNIKFEHHYLIEDKNKIKEFDFAIFDDKNNLKALIECDGLYWHGYLSDQDGIRVNIERDIERLNFIPENVKFISIIETQFEEGVKELFKVLEMNYDEYIQDIFNWCRSIEFPYPKYNEKVLQKSFDELCKYTLFKEKALIGSNLIRHFHHSIWHAKKDNLSPYEAWFDDKLLMKVIKNRLIYKNNIDPNRILEGFHISKICQKVTTFKAWRAKQLIEKYLNEFNTIFDPFSGYSGRMLGTISLNKNYIGQDINEIHIKESKNRLKSLCLIKY